MVALARFISFPVVPPALRASCALLLSVALATLSACSARGSFCDIEKPDRNPLSAMTVAEARAALAHNLKGEELCGWKP